MSEHFGGELASAPKCHQSRRERKDEIYTSNVHYLLKRGKPYIWVQEGDMHNVNTIIDERASLSVSTIIPGPLMGLLRSIKKFPARIALAGDMRVLKDDKDAFTLSVDRKGFDVLAKVPETLTTVDLSYQYHWKEFRFTFKEEAQDMDAFCRMLVELEEEALERFKTYSGLG